MLLDQNFSLRKYFKRYSTYYMMEVERRFMFVQIPYYIAYIV